MLIVRGRQITDECQYCGNAIQCELFVSGHGINCERSNVVEMVGCQMKHREKRMNTERQKEMCGTCTGSYYTREKGYRCVNRDSEYCNCYIEYDFKCCDYEPKFSRR